MNKIIGTAIAIISFVIALIGVVGCVKGNEIAHLLSMAIQGIDTTEWKQHWFFESLTYAVAGCIGFVAGIGALKNRKWGLCVWAWLLTALLASQAMLVFLGYAKFEFEKLNLIETLLTVVICISSWIYYLKMQSKPNHT